MDAPSTPGRYRFLRDLALGACLGAAVIAGVWHFLPGLRVPVPEGSAAGAALVPVVAVVPDAPAAPPAAASTVSGPCDGEPLVPAAGGSDGHASLEHPFPAGPRARAKVFLRAAEAATAQGRSRDAELAMLAACREYLKIADKPSVPLARVLASLAEHDVAAARKLVDLHEPLMARARQALALSADIYAQALGPRSGRARQARERLAALDDPAATAPVAVATEAALPRAAPSRGRPASDAGAPPRRVSRAQQQSQPAPPQQAQQHSQPEPQQASVETTPDPSSPEIAQLASDLARLRSQAESLTPDPAGFRLRAEAAQARRAQCGDAECVRAWYAKRRRELLAEF